MQTLNSQFRRKALSLTIQTLLLGVSITNVHASAFSLYGEANGRNAGDYASGAAADTSDASALFYNPAGLAFIRNKQVVAGGTFVSAQSKVTSGTLTWSGPFGAAAPLSISGEKTKSGAVIPALYYAHPFGDRGAWGIGVYVPFGLETDWNKSANTRYAATQSKLQIINISPAVSAHVTDTLAVGAALDLQHATVDFNSVGGLLVPSGTAVDSESFNHGTSLGVGGHIGLIYQPNKQLTIGVNYQSPVSHQFFGKSTLSGGLADPTGGGNPNSIATNNNLFSNAVSMPGQLTVGGQYRAKPDLTLMGTVAYTQWSSFNSIRLSNAVGPQADPATRAITVTVPQNFRNTWRISGGLKYQVNEKLGVRAGLGWDQTPVNNTDRNLRLPDADKFAVAIGGHYQVRTNLGLDIGYTHLFVKRTSINNTSVVGASSSLVQANMKASVDLVGAQLTWSIA